MYLVLCWMYRPGSPLFLMCIAAFIALAVWAAGVAGEAFGDPDDQRIVIDESAGLLVTLSLSPPSLATVILGVILFRLFDILKPWPANWADRNMKNAFGNVLDDVFAGIYGLLALELIKRFFGLN
jgi:phosphatidylglycerophosphatase A